MVELVSRTSVPGTSTLLVHFHHAVVGIVGKSSSTISIRGVAILLLPFTFFFFCVISEFINSETIHSGGNMPLQ
jgi:hypothetical protein